MKNYQNRVSEYENLLDLKPALEEKGEIDIDTYKLIDSSIDNYYNLTDEEYNQIRDFSENSQKDTQFMAIKPLQENAKNTLEFMKPYKLSKPVSRIREIKGNFNSNIIYVNIPVKNSQKSKTYKNPKKLMKAA